MKAGNRFAGHHEPHGDGSPVWAPSVQPMRGRRKVTGTAASESLSRPRLLLTAIGWPRAHRRWAA